MQACYLSTDGTWEIKDVPKPTLKSDDDIIIKVEATGICGSDLGILNGIYPISGHTIMGHEFAGTVEQIGTNINHWKIGDRVVHENTGSVCGECYLCAMGRFVECEQRQMIGGETYAGGFAEYVRIPGEILRLYPSSLFRIPEGISFEEAAIVDPLANGYKAVIQDSPLQAGESAVVFGAGAIGMACVMAAKLASAANIIAVDLSRAHARLHKAKELGATHIIHADKVDDVVESIKKSAGEEGVALACDCAAGAPDVMHQCIQATRNGGHVSSLGMSREPFQHSLVDVGLKNITIKGHMGYDNVSWRNVLTLMTRGMLPASKLISHTLPLSNFGEGLDLINAGEAVKVILYPGR